MGDILADAITGLRRGDFSRLAPLFFGDPPAISAWIASGALDPELLAEALSCASFNGAVAVVEALLAIGVPPNGGAGTGLDALHYAANRGQLDVVGLLLAAGARTDTISMYGGNALATAEWSAVHEPRPDHAAIIATLRAASAR